MQDRIHSKRLTRSPRARALAALALIAGVLVAGCGGGSQGANVAAVTGTTSGSSAASTGAATTSGSSAASTGAATTSSSAATGNAAASSNPTTPAALAADSLAYSRCMRAHGVPNFPDPSPGGGFLFHKSSGLDPSSPLVEAARAKCQKYMPGGGPPGPGTQTHPSAQAVAQMVKVAQCMRRHGISNFPDPRTSVPSNPFGGGAGVITDIDGVILLFPATIDERSPEFTRAAAACAFPLHNH